MEDKKLISVIVPCYNEQEVLPLFYKEITKVSKEMQEAHPELEFEYLFIDDGSKDRTLRTLRIMAKYDKRVRYISFSRNFGKEAGIYAGLKNAKGDYCVVMDADLQHPPAFLPQMYEAVASGRYDCATTRRISREGESKVRSWFARLFYKIMNKISQTEIVDGAQDFRFMTRQMVDAVLSMSEYNRFSKGIFSWVGFRVKYLEYQNVERAAGTSAWSFWGLFRYSLEGIIGFSTAPLSISAIIGFITCVLGLIMLVATVIKKLTVGEDVIGYPTIICTILFFGGLQLFCTGILGLYLGKTYLEVKRRPIYLARETEADAETALELEDEAAEEAETAEPFEEDDTEDEAAEAAAAAEAESMRALEKAQRLKQEADEEFDAIVDAALDETDDADEDEEIETLSEFIEKLENTDEAAAGEDAAEESAAAEPEAEATAEADDTADAEETLPPKKEKFEVNIDYDSIDFSADYDEDEASAEETYDESEAEYDDEYDEEAYDDEYDDYDEEYDEDYDGEYDEEYGDEYDGDYDDEYDAEYDESAEEDAPLTLRDRFAMFWERVKDKVWELSHKNEAQDADAYADDDEYDDYDAEYDDDGYDDDADYDDEYDDEAYDDEAYDEEAYEAEAYEEDSPAVPAEDEDDSAYRGAHF